MFQGNSSVSYPRELPCKFIHSFIHLVVHASIIHSSIQTATHLTKNCTGQRLRWCSRDEWGMKHTQALGGLLNSHWPQVVPMVGGWDGQAEDKKRRGSQGFLSWIWTLRDTKIYITILKDCILKLPYHRGWRETCVHSGQAATGSPFQAMKGWVAHGRRTEKEDSWVAVSTFSSLCPQLAHTIHKRKALAVNWILSLLRAVWQLSAVTPPHPFGVPSSHPKLIIGILTPLHRVLFLRGFW